MFDEFAHLPIPLTITLDRQYDDEGHGEGMPDVPWFEATSPQYSGLSGSGEGVDEAVAALVNEILDAQPLPPDLVQALLSAGYSRELVETWDQTMRAHHRTHRYDPDAALSILKEYTDGGVPALVGCQFFALGMSPVDATRVHAGGGTPAEAREYLQGAESPRWWRWEFDVMPWLAAGFPYHRGRLYAYTCSVEQAVVWEEVVTRRGISDADLSACLHLGLTSEAVADGFPTARVALYVAMDVRAEHAAEWETVAAKHAISDSDLGDIIRAGFTPQSAERNAVAHAEQGLSLGDAARTQLATKPLRSADPWLYPAGDPWSIPDSAPHC